MDTSTDTAVVGGPAPAPRRALPRLAAAAAVTAALVAGGAAATGRPASSGDTTVVASIINAWPKKYTGAGLVAEPPGDAGSIS